MTGFFRPRGDGIDLFIRLKPKSSRDAVEGVEIMADGRSHLAVRVRAVPEKGAANASLENLVATLLGVPKRGVSVVSGGASRLKTVRVAGDADLLVQRLARLGSANDSG